MRQDKVIGIILAVMSVILVVVCAVLYIGMDRVAPTIEFQAASFDYLEGMDQAELLRGVSAFDTNDGDVTERIVIEKIIENKENNTVVVFYAVSDKSGNAAKASRVFDAIYMEEEKGSGRFPEAGIDADISLSGEIYQMETDAETEISQQDPESEAVPDQTPEPYDRDKAGSYAVNAHTEDSDGNKSQSVPLTIIVE